MEAKTPMLIQREEAEKALKAAYDANDINSIYFWTGYLLALN